MKAIFLIELAFIKLTWLITLCACLCCFSKSLKAVTNTANATAKIIIAMSISTQSNLAFGDISTSSTSGSVILSTDGSRSSVGGATINSTLPGSPAEFNAVGEPGGIFSISMPASVQLTDPSNNNSMVVDSFISNPVDTGQLDDSGNTTVTIGATLHVNGQQAFGEYTGLMALNVDYN